MSGSAGNNYVDDWSADSLVSTVNATAPLPGAQISTAQGALACTGDASSALPGAQIASAAGVLLAGSSSAITLPGAGLTLLPGEIAAAGQLGAVADLVGAEMTLAAGSLAAAGQEDATTIFEGAGLALSAGEIAAVGGHAAVAMLMGAQQRLFASDLQAGAEGSAALIGAQIALAAGAMLAHNKQLQFVLDELESADLDLILADEEGFLITIGAITRPCIFEQSDGLALRDPGAAPSSGANAVIAAQAVALVKTSDFPSAKGGDTCTVSCVTEQGFNTREDFRIWRRLRIHEGAMTELQLKRLQ
jgi:hypothetical protein